MRSNWPALVVALTAMALGSAGCTDPAPADDRVIRAHGYAVDSSPDSALAFFDNAYVFEGTVTAVHADRRVTDTLSSGRTIEAVYTPVTVLVERSYLGDAAAGSKVTVRSMGGKAGDLAYVIDEAPAKATFTPGTRLVIFGGVRSTLDLEPEPAITPHFVYRAAANVFVDMTYAHTADPARTRIPSVDLRHKLEKLNAKARAGG
jgi:hypothetical protein